MDIRVHGPEGDAAERSAVDSALDAADVRPARHLLLPALHAVQSRFGWLTPGALNYISRRMDLPPAELFGVATFYHLFSLTPQPPHMIHVCDDIACRIKGAENICAELDSAKVAWKRSPCLGQCERAPAALVIEAGENPRSFLRGPAQDLRSSAPQFGKPGLRLLRRVGRVDPGSVEAYRADGGYEALKRAFELGPQAVIQEVLKSNLVGRGGAAFTN
jgi:NADH-quinone oxidoreductase subunit F